MKIVIKPEPFIKNPAPKLTKAMFDYFWGTLWSFRLEYYVDCIETIHVKVNQALPHLPVHFYVTVNGVHEFHKEYSLDELNPLQYSGDLAPKRKKNFLFVLDTVTRNR